LNNTENVTNILYGPSNKKNSAFQACYGYSANANILPISHDKI